MDLHARIAPTSRAAIEAEIERLIALLDLADGDCDLEEDDAAGGNVEDEPQMGVGQDYYRMPPCYGIDQSKGPINEHEAYRQHRRDMGCVDA